MEEDEEGVKTAVRRRPKAWHAAGWIRELSGVRAPKHDVNACAQLAGPQVVEPDQKPAPTVPWRCL